MKNLIEPKILTYSVFRDFLRSLCKDRENIRLSSLGKTYLGRDICAIVLGEGEKNILFIGGTHGLEWMTSLVLLRFAEELLSEEHICGFNTSEVLNKVRLVIVPEVNPDGIEIAIKGACACGEYKELAMAAAKGDFSSWNSNARGVDINHNFNADWYSLRQKERAAGICSASPGRFGGAYPESEAETAALTRLCRSVRFETAFSFHSQGEEIFYEYGSFTPEKSLTFAKVLAALSEYTLVKNEGLASSGGFKDWFIEEFARPAFTIEIGRGENPLPLSDFESVYKKIREMMIFSLML